MRVLPAAGRRSSVTRIHGFESEDVAEKYAVRLGVFAVVNHVRASKSFGSPKRCRELLAGSMFRGSL